MQAESTKCTLLVLENFIIYKKFELFWNSTFSRKHNALCIEQVGWLDEMAEAPGPCPDFGFRYAFIRNNRSKNNWGRILGLAWLKFAVVPLYGSGCLVACS